MNLAFVTLVDITGTSGQNLYSRNIAEALYKHDQVNLSIICPAPSNPIPEILSNSDVDFFYLPEKRSQDLSWQLQIQPRLFRQLLCANVGDQLDGIVTPLKAGLLVPPLYSAAKSLPQILIVEGMLENNISKQDPFPGAVTLVRILTSLNVSNSFKIFVAYEKAGEWIKSRQFLSNTPISVFHHGVNVEKFKPIPISEARNQLNLDISNDQFVIGYAGSFKEYHCLSPLLHAAKSYEGEVKLLLVGEGPEKEKIESLADSLDVWAHFPGFVQQEQLYKYISACNVGYGVIDPNHWGSPMKVFEYLSCGRPVIVQNQETLEFFKTHNFGEVVDYPRPEKIESAIDSLYKTPDSKLISTGNRGREYIMKNRTWDNLANDIVTVIEHNND